MYVALHPNQRKKTARHQAVSRRLLSPHWGTFNLRFTSLVDKSQKFVAFIFFDTTSEMLRASPGTASTVGES